MSENALKSWSTMKEMWMLKLNSLKKEIFQVEEENQNKHTKFDLKFKLPLGSIQLSSYIEEQKRPVDMIGLIEICLKSYILKKQKGITLVVSDYNLFYNPDQETYKLLPFFD